MISNIEDLINPYILEFREELSKHNISEFNNLIDSLYNESSVTDKFYKFGFDLVTDIKPDIYIKYLKRSLNTIDSMEVDVGEFDTFFSAVYNSLALDDANLSIPFRSDSEIKHIRPDYLKSVYNDIVHIVKLIIDKKISKKDLYIKYFNNDIYLNKMKNRLVDTTYTMADVRDLMIMDSPEIVNVSNVFIQHNIIPFIRSYTPNIQEIRSQIVHTIGQINNIYADTKKVINYISDMETKDMSHDTVILLRYFIFNMITVMMKLSAYLSAMLLIKSSCMLFNIKSCVELYNIIKSQFPEMENVLHESVIDGNITDIDNTTLFNSVISNNPGIIIPHIQKAVGLKKMEIANYVSKQFEIKIRYDSDMDVSKYPYDGRPYAAINKSLVDIMKNLSVFRNECNKDEDSVDGIASVAHLNEPFSIRYVNVINNIENVIFYTSQLSDMKSSPDAILSLFNDISSFERNLLIIFKNMKKVYDMINSMILEYDHDLIGSDEIFTNDVKSFIEGVMNNYKEYIIHVIRNLLNRLDTLTDLMNDDPETNVSNAGYESVSAYDYTLDVYNEEYNEIVNHEKSTINDLFWKYKRLKSIKDRGVDLIREDVKPAETNGSNSTSSSTPKVEGVPKSNESDNSSTTQQSSQDQNKKGWLERFKEFIDKMLQKFSKKIKDVTTKNDKWLVNQKSKLKNIDTTNVTITVAKYEGLNISKLSSDITSSINKINSINASNPPQEMIKSRESCEFYLFPSIPEKVGNETSFSGRIKRFYTYGTSDKQELTSYSGADAKTKLDEIIQFCEEYSKSANNLVDLIKKLSDTAIKKETEIINSSSNANTNQNNNNGESSYKIESAISSATREYCGAIPTVMEKKYMDYYKVLSALAGNTSQKSQKKDEDDYTNNDDKK